MLGRIILLLIILLLIDEIFGFDNILKWFKKIAEQ